MHTDRGSKTVNREHILARLSLSRPVTVVMIFVALMVIGIITYVRMPIGLLPSGQDNQWMWMWIEYPNASPVEVEEQIARPVEGILRGMTGVRRVNSTSLPNGCRLSVQFNDGVDMDEAHNSLRDRLDRILAEMPEGVDRIQIRQWNNDDIPVIGLDFVVKEDHPDLYALLEEQMKRPLEMVDGVANAEIHGTGRARVEISLAQDKINTHRVNMFQLVRQLRRDNFALSSGWVYDGSSKIYVRSDSRFSSMERIRNLPIEGHADLKLRDIATVKYLEPEVERLYRVDGKPGISIVIFKESRANTVEVCAAVVEKLENDLYRRPQLKMLEAHLFLNLADNIQATLTQLRSSGLWGGLFAIFVLYAFLRRMGMTLVITTAIPLSVMISMAVIYSFGWTLNIATMMGLIIGLGMVVDNSIVVVEAIYARRLRGDDPHTASLRGASEVGLAITVSTLTTLVVFLPLIFMSGSQEMSFWFSRIGMPVIYALVGSLVVALLFIPLVAKHLLAKAPPRETKTIARVGESYVRILRWGLRHRLEGALIAFGLFATIMVPKVASDMRGGGSFIPRVFVHLEMPRHYTLAMADSIFAQYERFLMVNQEKYGTNEVEAAFDRGGGDLWSNFNRDEREWYTVGWQALKGRLGLESGAPKSEEEVTEDIRTHGPKFAGVKISFTAGWNRHRTMTSVTLFGDDTKMLVRLAGEVERRLRAVSEIRDVESEIHSSRDELKVLVSRDRARKIGIDATSVANTLNYVVRGVQLTPYQTPDRDVDLWLGLRKDDRRTLDQVLNLEMVGATGARAPLRSLVNTEPDRALDVINRQNGKTSVQLFAMGPTSDDKKLADKISAALSGLEMPPGYQWTLSGRFEQMEEQNTDMMFAIIMAILFVFLLMGILFESFLLPLSVLLAIPFSFLGVRWLLYALGMKMNIMGNIGLIVLIGVVVNNAIVLVDLVNVLRAEGVGRTDAILEAGRQRFRPILMTSATTIFGLVPIAIGNSKMLGMSYNSLGVTMIGGLLSSTLLTLFVVPLFYTFFDDVGQMFSRMMGLVTVRVKAPVEAAGETAKV